MAFPGNDLPQASQICSRRARATYFRGRRSGRRGRHSRHRLRPRRSRRRPLMTGYVANSAAHSVHVCTI